MKTVQSQQHNQYKEENKYEDGRTILVALKSYMFSKQLYQKYMNVNFIKNKNGLNIFKKTEKVEKKDQKVEKS